MEDILKKVQKLKPQPGECFILWTEKLNHEQTEQITDWINDLKKIYPFTIFLSIPTRKVIKGLKTYKLEELKTQLDSLSQKIEAMILSRK